MDQFRESSDDAYLTSEQGLRINHTDDSLKAAHFELGNVKDKEIRKRVIYELFNHVDHGFAVMVAKGVGIAPPPLKRLKTMGKSHLP